eukprot:8241212-Pyramimonas_sp.AAC.1
MRLAAVRGAPAILGVLGPRGGAGHRTAARDPGRCVDGRDRAAAGQFGLRPLALLLVFHPR